MPTLRSPKSSPHSSSRCPHVEREVAFRPLDLMPAGIRSRGRNATLRSTWGQRDDECGDDLGERRVGIKSLSRSSGSYRWAVFISRESGSPVRLKFSNNLFAPGTEGISKVPL